MKIEKLRNKKSYKWFLCGLILVVVLTITYKVSKANYRISNNIELTTGKVVSSPYDFNIVSIYIDGVEQEKGTIMPGKGYVINEEMSYCCNTSPCNNDNKDKSIKLYTNIIGEHIFSGISKGSKCNLFFNKKEIVSAKDYILLGKGLAKRTSENKDFNVPYGEANTNIYTAPDDNGTSYYFAGNPISNWAEFAGYYWRIIRINGDGTIRMIYQGRTQDENGKKLEPQVTGEETQIGVSPFSKQMNDNAYVGYMYGTPGSLTYEDTHANINDSTIKQALDNWFNNSNLKQSENFNKIDLNAGFCGDRTPSTSNIEINNQGGVGTTMTKYGTLIRIRPEELKVTPNSSTVMPKLSCTNSNDLYTYKGGVINDNSYAASNKGNKSLKYPVGLITADEVAYAGMVSNWIDIDMMSKDNYLYTGLYYWTMSPAGYDWNLCVYNNGNISGYDLSATFGIRPVINIRSDVTLSGNGTSSNPYKIVS